MTGVVTAIAPARRPAGRFDVQVDGAPFATLSLDAIERLGLAVGRPIAGLEERIAGEADALRVYDRAVLMLAARARSSVELGRLLMKKGEDKALAARAVARLVEQGLLDDAAFARSFTRARVLGGKQSRRRVQLELARKGVPRETTDAAIAAVFEEEQVDQSAIVEEAARKKLRSLLKLEPAVRRRRLYGFLARRGYDSEDIRRALASIGEGMKAGDGDAGDEDTAG